MRFSTFLLGAAALIGVGAFISKKLSEKNADTGNSDESDDSVYYAEENETYGDKLHKASMYTVGAIKTGADKIAEGFKEIKEIKSEDMVKKGEEAVEQIKETTDNIKKDIEELKNMVTSINANGGTENEEMIAPEYEFSDVNDDNSVSDDFAEVDKDPFDEMEEM